MDSADYIKKNQREIEDLDLEMKILFEKDQNDKEDEKNADTNINETKEKETVIDEDKNVNDPLLEKEPAVAAELIEQQLEPVILTDLNGNDWIELQDLNPATVQDDAENQISRNNVERLRSYLGSDRAARFKKLLIVLAVFGLLCCLGVFIWYSLVSVQYDKVILISFCF
jgi:hypothetical protein